MVKAQARHKKFFERRGGRCACAAAESLRAAWSRTACVVATVGVMGRYWAFVVLAGVLWGPQLCGGALNNCRGVPGFELPPDK